MSVIERPRQLVRKLVRGIPEEFLPKPKATPIGFDQVDELHKAVMKQQGSIDFDLTGFSDDSLNHQYTRLSFPGKNTFMINSKFVSREPVGKDKLGEVQRRVGRPVWGMLPHILPDGQLYIHLQAAPGDNFETRIWFGLEKGEGTPIRFLLAGKDSWVERVYPARVPNELGRFKRRLHHFGLSVAETVRALGTPLSTPRTVFSPRF